VGGFATHIVFNFYVLLMKHFFLIIKMNNDTIAAVSTGLQPAGVAIIRVSGKDSVRLVNSIFKGDDLTKALTHTVHYGFIISGDDVIDEVLVSVFLSPRSYTGEDVCEIGCHGGVDVVEEVLHTLFSAGVRSADPGEFTKRAFQNGRIDLTQAESVMELIKSQDSFSRKAAVHSLMGNVSSKINIFRDEILDMASFIEAALDDPEHYDLSDYRIKLRKKIISLSSDLHEMILHFDEGSLLKNGIRTVIAGRPNVGKSSLLNLLLHRERAIVTSVPGTTRDTIEETCNLGGIRLLLSDTAGIRETDDIVEHIGVDRSVDAIKNSDLCLFLIDGTKPIEESDTLIYNLIPDNVIRIILINKSDLLNRNDSHFMNIVSEKFNGCDNVILFSAKSGDGLNQLTDSIRNLFFENKLPNPDEVYLVNEREKQDLDSALKSLSLVVRSIDEGMTEDFFTSDLMDAYNSLGNIIGANAGDDLIDRIFSKFCMGK
jgi:tRNA modification GTPase